MKTGISYLILGILFAFLAIRSVDHTIWNFTTILLAGIATLDIGLGIRYLLMHFRLNEDKKK